METKHLEFTQAIISRLAGNSFQMKAWNVALATAAIGFAAAKDAHAGMAVLAIVPSIAFWFLDAYYLGLEKLFRDPYKSLTQDPDHPSFDIAAGPLSPGRSIDAVLRPSVIGLHLPILSVILLAGLMDR
jgi:hypothetical protein